jgi:hypothetical protein
MPSLSPSQTYQLPIFSSPTSNPDHHSLSSPLSPPSNLDLPMHILPPINIPRRSGRVRHAPKSHDNYISHEFLEHFIGIIEEGDEPLNYE